MFTSKDLKFKNAKPDKSPPVETCCNCGKRSRLSTLHYVANVAISKTAHYTFVVCDLHCLVAFKSYHNEVIVNKFINDRISEAIEVYNANIKK